MANLTCQLWRNFLPNFTMLRIFKQFRTVPSDISQYAHIVMVYMIAIITKINVMYLEYPPVQ